MLKTNIQPQLLHQTIPTLDAAQDTLQDPLNEDEEIAVNRLLSLGLADTGTSGDDTLMPIGGANNIEDIHPVPIQLGTEAVGAAIAKLKSAEKQLAKVTKENVVSKTAPERSLEHADITQPTTLQPKKPSTPTEASQPKPANL